MNLLALLAQKPKQKTIKAAPLKPVNPLPVVIKKPKKVD